MVNKSTRPLVSSSLFLLLLLTTTSLIKCTETSTDSTDIINNSTQVNSTTPDEKQQCFTHANCTGSIFNLDSFCCESINKCCNWYTFTLLHRQSSESPKLIMPTIFTVLISLILFICVLFVSYCVCILFCYLSKRGLFRKPKILIISEQSSTSTNYDEANSNDPTANNSPKHSTGSCTSSCSSSSCSSYSHRRSKPTTSSSYHYHNRPRSTHRPTSGQTSSSYRATSSAAGAAARQPQSQRSSSYRPTSSTSSSSTTRAGNSSRPSQCRQKHNRTSVPSTSQSRASTSARSSSQLYAEPECYVDFDTDSPFLIPTSHATQKPNSRSKRTRSSPTRRRSGQTSSSRSHSSQQTRVSETAGMISGEHQLETIHSAIASSRSSVSLDFGAPLMETVEIAAAESGIVLSNNSINQGTNIQSSSHMIMMSSYYQDEEKPPSYDEIIRNSSSVAPN